MPDLPVVILILTWIADATLFLFVGYYFWKLRDKEIELETKQGKYDKDYHQVVDAALAKERKIIEDATAAADQIIAKAKEINLTATTDIARTLEEMVKGVQEEAKTTAKVFNDEYQNKLDELSQQSAADFELVFKQMREGMLLQIEEFHKTTQPALKKEIDEYRKMKMEEVDKKAITIAQKAAEEIFNKSLPLEDQQNLVITALEKAKKEGLFE